MSRAAGDGNALHPWGWFPGVAATDPLRAHTPARLPSRMRAATMSGTNSMIPDVQAVCPSVGIPGRSDRYTNMHTDEYAASSGKVLLVHALQEVLLLLTAIRV